MTIVPSSGKQKTRSLITVRLFPFKIQLNEQSTMASPNPGTQAASVLEKAKQISPSILGCYPNNHPRVDFYLEMQNTYVGPELVDIQGG